MRGQRKDLISRRGVPALILALLVAVVPACSPEDPEDQLAEAFGATLGSSFSYEVNLESDETGGGEVASALRGLAATGVRGDGAWSTQVTVLGFDIFELHSEDPELRHLRLGLADVLSLVGGPDADPSAALVQELEARDHEAETVEVVRAALQGDWITIEGPLDAADLDRAIGVDGPVGERPDAAAVLEALGGDLRSFVEDYVEVRDVDEAGDTQVFDVEVRVRDAVRALSRLGEEGPQEVDLEDLPERLPGTVIVSDDVVREIIVGFGEADDEPSQTRLHVELGQHGEAPAVTSPDGSLRVGSERFIAALQALSEVFGETEELPFP